MASTELFKETTPPALTPKLIATAGEACAKRVEATHPDRATAFRSIGFDFPPNPTVLSLIAGYVVGYEIQRTNPSLSPHQLYVSKYNLEDEAGYVIDSWKRIAPRPLADYFLALGNAAGRLSAFGDSADKDELHLFQAVDTLLEGELSGDNFKTLKFEAGEVHLRAWRDPDLRLAIYLPDAHRADWSIYLIPGDGIQSKKHYSYSHQSVSPIADIPTLELLKRLLADLVVA